MYGADVVIESSCRPCGEAVSIETTQDGLALGTAQPGDSVVWYDLAYDCSAATSCCPSIAFFCCDEHLRQWLATQAVRPEGYRLALAEALEMGRALLEPVLKKPGVVEEESRDQSQHSA
jgi:alkylmercury lyase